MAIWLNVKNIFKFAFLGFAIMYIYGIIGWNFFRDFYGNNGWTFLHTITYSIKEGLRAGGYFNNYKFFINLKIFLDL